MPQTSITPPDESTLALVRERGLLLLTSVGGAPSLVDVVAGETVKGSWWGHAAAQLIFEKAAALEASPEVLVLKLVGGKVTFVHRALWPALVRVARDPARVAAIAAALSPAAARLHAEVEKCGEVRLDQLARQPAWPPERDLARAAKELENGILVHAANVHTERGQHTTGLRSWARAMPDSARREAAHLSLDEALALLRRHGAELAPALATRPARSRVRSR